MLRIVGYYPLAAPDLPSNFFQPALYPVWTALGRPEFPRFWMDSDEGGIDR